MIYTFKCPSCGVEEDIYARVSDFSQIRTNAHCNDCGVPAVLRINPPKTVFGRSPFPKGFSEHISPDGHYIRDKKEAMAIAEENGLTSVYCENAC